MNEITRFTNLSVCVCGGGGGGPGRKGGWTLIRRSKVPKDRSSFYGIRSLAICIYIKTINWTNRKQLKILKTFLECQTFCTVVYKVVQQSTFWGLVSYKRVAYKKTSVI